MYGLATKTYKKLNVKKLDSKQHEDKLLGYGSKTDFA